MNSIFLDHALLPSGWARCVRLSIQGARFVDVQAAQVPTAADERYAIGIPGIANLHSHAFQRGMAGLAERRGPATDSFWTWREQMYRFLRVLDPDDVEAIAALAYSEMLEAGFTRVGEFHYLHHDIDGGRYANLAEMVERIVAAAGATGIGLTLLPSLYAHGGLGGQPPNEGQRRFINGLDQFSSLFEQSRHAVAALQCANIGVAPHSLRAVTPHELANVVALAGAGPIHIHAAEQTKEVEDCVAWSNKRPVEWLLDTQPIDRRWCFIHATHMTPEETSRLAQSGAVAGLCPVTEANLGDGIFNGAEFMRDGGGFGVGTDSNVQISLAHELRQLEYAQRLKLRQRNVLARGEGRSTGQDLFEAALRGGAQALGLSHHGLATGAPADVVALDPKHPALIHRDGDAWLDGWIFGTNGRVVDTVWSLGRKVVSDGRHIDRDRLRTRYSAVIAKVLQA